MSRSFIEWGRDIWEILEAHPRILAQLHRDGPKKNVIVAWCNKDEMWVAAGPSSLTFKFWTIGYT